MVTSGYLTGFLVPREFGLYAGNGVVATPNEGVYPQKVSKVWNVASDGSLEASLYGPFNLTILHTFLKQTS